MDIKMLMYLIAITSLYANIAVSMYCIIAKPNLVKKFIALTILQDTVNIFLIMGGYKLWKHGLILQPPVFMNWQPTPTDIEEFVLRAVDPLPQALVLTAVVIGLAVNIFLATVILHLYRHFKTTDMDEIGRLKREMVYGEIA